MCQRGGIDGYTDRRTGVLKLLSVRELRRWNAAAGGSELIGWPVSQSRSWLGAACKWDSARNNTHGSSAGRFAMVSMLIWSTRPRPTQRKRSKSPLQT